MARGAKVGPGLEPLPRLGVVLAHPVEGLFALHLFQPQPGVVVGVVRGGSSGQRHGKRPGGQAAQELQHHRPAMIGGPINRCGRSSREASPLFTHTMTVLHRQLPLHRARRQPRQGLRLIGRKLPHRQLVQPRQLVADAGPPDVGRAAVDVQRDALSARAGLGQPALVGLADLDPVQQLAAKVVLPQVGLVAVGQAARELQRAVVGVLRHVQREGQQPHQQPLFGFGRVKRQRQRVVGVQLPVHVGDLQRRLVDG